MNLLNELDREIARQEIAHYERAIETLGDVKEDDKLGQSVLEHNKYNLQRRQDALLVMEALLKIDIEFCQKKGIDIADLIGAIKRLSK